MKKLLLILGIVCSASIVFAQGYTKGTKNLNVGAGFGYGLGLNASADVGITDVVSVGAVVGVSRRSYGLIGYKWSVNYLVVGGRVAAHLGKYLKEPLSLDTDKIDPYVGVTGGFRTVNYDDNFTGYDGIDAGIMLGGYAGVRYQFNKALGLYVEAGSPFTTVGVTFKF